MAPKIIAFHLPQFHPIPENDEWWGKGFTEWTNVAKAKPLFRGHHQPNVPADLGFYDLRLPEARELQVEYARRAGVHGFCFWHYWFGNGRRLLERPVDEMLATGSPDFPFMLGWANQTWTGIWHGAKNRILVEQKYLGKEDIAAHCRLLVKHFEDRRYITVDGRPLLYIYDPGSAGLTADYVLRYRETLLRDYRIEPLIIMRANGSCRSGVFACADALSIENIRGAVTLDTLPTRFTREYLSHPSAPGETRNLFRKARSFVQEAIRSAPERIPYQALIESLRDLSFQSEQIPCILPNWDNTPRSGTAGLVVTGSTPALFGEYLDAMFAARRTGPFKDVYMLKSWNEWAEGNYLEPDLRFGDAYMRMLRQKVDAYAAQGQPVF